MNLKFHPATPMGIFCPIEKGGVDDKKIILKAIDSNLYLKDKKLDIQARTPFLLIKNAVEETQRINKLLEPNEMPVFLEKNGELYPQNPIWGDRRGSNPQPVVPQTTALPLSYDHQIHVHFTKSSHY